LADQIAGTPVRCRSPASCRPDSAALNADTHPQAIAAVADAIDNVLRDHPDGLSGSECWSGPLPNL
jgi:hypothetical protein